MDQKTIALLDKFTHQTIEIITQALAEKDQTIRDLQAKLANCNCQEATHE